MNLSEILHHRRSVRVFDKQKPLDTEKVRECIELSTLAPNSSNMQLWEFYHITDPELKEKVSHACLKQSATSTADQMVVFVTRQDLYKERAKGILAFERENIKKYSPEERHAKRIKQREMYYGRIMPFLYSRFFGLLGFFRVLMTQTTGLFRTIVRQVSENDMKVVIHKSTALAAQTFMIAMANEGYDTCPLEGFDSKVLKKALKLPRRAEINMVIACGVRDGNKGIWGERYRVPFEKVYRKL
ncbi:nitroreductase family protein [Aureicoccus marinus]|uniref:Nitroreductase family protein n=1 Tax=Aureicoccus marinus TaxID=754435 RepID=A0A2S7T8X4_9FLAO|nr:nitroreductase family protein [Aureicoccus marinus]PQJ16104.1 nitroreductase family protein [Aureicoccus marinus]